MTNSTTLQVEAIAQHACHCGENPLWHPTERKLYWVDIPQGRLFAFDFRTGEHGLVYEGRPIGGITLQTDGDLLLFRDRGTIEVLRRGEIIKTVLKQIPEELHTRFNDVIADPCGRVFCGTMAVKKKNLERRGRLYRLDPDGSYRIVVDGIACANGMGFTTDCNQFYFTDSFDAVIYLFDYDVATGNLSNQRIFVQESDHVVPDGMTVDRNGDIWSARWGEGCVVRYTPDGIIRETIHLPTPKISSLTFGGEDLTQMYVTSAGGQDQPCNGPEAGALFRITGSDVQGAGEFYSNTGMTKSPIITSHFGIELPNRLFQTH